MLCASETFEMVTNIRTEAKKQSVSLMGSKYHRNLGGWESKITLEYSTVRHRCTIICLKCKGKQLKIQKAQKRNRGRRRDHR